MKKDKAFFIIGIIIFVASVASLIIFKSYNKVDRLDGKALSNDCGEEIYYDNNGQRIYSYCLENIEFDGKELNDLLDGGLNIDDLFKDLEKEEIYKDGGSILYRGEKLSILQCNTIEGNNDIYIGTRNMKYENQFCKRKKIFVRTYKILDVFESNDYDYLYVTLRQFQAEEVETVKVERKLFDEVEVLNDYEITFKNKNIKEDSIKEIFLGSEIISVSKTEKIGLEQVNEDI